MKYLAWLASAGSVYLGVKSLLNVIGLADDSPYSQGATAVYAVLWLSIAGSALYLTTFRKRAGWGLAIAVGPFVVLVLVMFAVLATGDWR